MPRFGAKHALGRTSTLHTFEVLMLIFGSVKFEIANS